MAFGPWSVKSKKNEKTIYLTRGVPISDGRPGYPRSGSTPF